MRLSTILLLIAAMLLAACGPTEEEAPDPLELLIEAADNIRASDTFRMEVRHSGVTYFVETELGSVAFTRALAQYVAPDVMQANVNVQFLGLRQDLRVFARGDDQWFQLASSPWVKGLFAPGFNPERMIAEDDGFQAAMSALLDIEMLGAERLEDGTPVWHMRGVAEGPIVQALLVGLIEARDDVIVDVYVHRETRQPARLIIEQPETVEEGSDEQPTTWTVDIYDINAEPDLDEPDVDAVPQAEATLQFENQGG